MENPKKFNITIEVEKLDKGAMFLHEQLGSGEAKGKQFTIDQIIGGGGIVLNVGKFEEYQRYRVSIQNIITPLLDFHFEKGKDIKVAEMKTIKNPKVLTKKQ